jgi:hypothetical protein
MGVYRRKFLGKMEFPNCLGSIDGKHTSIHIVAPVHSGHMFFNYNGFFSIVLLAVADANYIVMYADVGCQGRISVGGVFNHTTLYEKMRQGKLGIPEPKVFPGRTQPVPYVFVADDAFALSKNMKPYTGQKAGSSSPERIFNYRLSRARRIMKNVFGIFSSKFIVLLKTIALHPDKVESVVLSCIYLHNVLRGNAASKSTYTPPGSFDS